MPGHSPGARIQEGTGTSSAASRCVVRRFGAAYRAQLRAFLAALRDGTPPAVTGIDALAAFEIGLAATYAAQTGEPVALDAVREG